MSRGAGVELGPDLLSCCLLRERSGTHRITIRSRLLCSCTPVAGGQAASGGLHIISSSEPLFFTLHIAAGPAPPVTAVMPGGGSGCGNNAAGAGPRGALWRCQHCHQSTSRMQQQITWPGVSDRLPPPGDTQMMEICSPIVLCSLM